MKLVDIIKISYTNLLRQKVRTLLTIFSIVIGATLISLVYSIIPGFRNFFDLQFQILSSPKLIEIYASKERPAASIMDSFGSAPQEYKEGESSGLYDLMLTNFKEEDIKKIENIKGVVKYHDCPIPNVEYIGLEDSDKKFKSNMIFYYPSFMLSNIKLVSGRSLNDSDKGKVLIAYDFIKAFGYQNGEELIGKKIILHIKQNLNKDTAGLTIMPTLDETQEVVSKDFEFEIAGITEKTILSSIIFVSLVDAVDMVKFSRNTEEVLTDKDNQRFFGFVEIDDAKNAEYIMDEIKNMGFSGQTYEQSKNILGMIFDILTIIFSSFGILAMAVSSLGIVNTLIMAVYERTREIGVMKALGANRFTIIKLFTVEAGLIGTIAGLLGLIIGFGISELLNYIGHKTIFSSFETLDISNITFLILLAPIISIVVSILAGIYPALKASKLNPVDALKYE